MKLQSFLFVFTEYIWDGLDKNRLSNFLKVEIYTIRILIWNGKIIVTFNINFEPDNHIFTYNFKSKIRAKGNLCLETFKMCNNLSYHNQIPIKTSTNCLFIRINNNSPFNNNINNINNFRYNNNQLHHRPILICRSNYILLVKVKISLLIMEKKIIFKNHSCKEPLTRDLEC